MRDKTKYRKKFAWTLVGSAIAVARWCLLDRVVDSRMFLGASPWKEAKKKKK